LVPTAGNTIETLQHFVCRGDQRRCPRAFSGARVLTGSKLKKTHFTVALAMFAGFGLGAVAVQGIHAQAKPPVYQITEIVPDNMATYVKDYVPRAQAAIKAAGGRILAGGTATAVEGDAPKPRVAVTAWDSAEKFQAYRNSAAFKELLPTRDKLAKFRSFTVEGLPN
jgi:uncharacterized protein (DUF1330 family)